ncbi:MAG: TrbI/VirB10 family protein [Novosphingobium sp.]
MTSYAATDPREQSPLEELRPQVELPRDGVPMPLMVALALVLGLALFLYLDANRRARSERDLPKAGSTAHLPAPPPQLLIPPAPPPEPALVAPPVAAPAPIVVPQPRIFNPIPRLPRPVLVPTPIPQRTRGGEPALVIDTTTGNGVAVTGSVDAGAGDDAVRATLIRNRGSIIPQGAIIAAVLETPLNSDRPGLARAIVSQDARSFDGSRVLIPRGSRLIGEFKADTNVSLRRVLVTWTRLIRPDGVAIRIGSPVTDALGGAGAAGSVNTHFFERFASAVLQSALTVGVNVASQSALNGSSVYVGLPGQAAQVGQALVPNTNRPPTVKVREGSQVAVLVAHDLDFGGTPAVR